MRKNIIIGILVVALISVSVWVYFENQMKVKYQTYLENSYQDDFQELLTSVKNIQALLSKAMVSASNTLTSELLSDAWKYSDFAQSNLNRLPVGHTALKDTSQFLSQLGDFAYAMNKIKVSGGELSEEQWNDLERLKNSSTYLLQELQVMNQQMDEGGVKFGDIRREGKIYLSEASENVVNKNFTSVEKEMAEYPKLIYDGPFSDHLKDIKPKWIKGEEITQEEGKQKAIEFIGEKSVKKVESYGSSEGIIPTFVYNIELSNETDSAIVEITKTGGHVLMVMRERQPKEQKISMEDAKKLVDKFLAEKGYENLTNTYYEKYTNVGVFNYAYTEEDVVIYPDLIKIQIALDNGDILGLESQGFHIAHHEREIPTPTLTLEEARGKVSERLEITKERLAIIPTEFKTEELCYEFKGTYKNEWYIVYINAMTGKEQQILKIIEADESVLTL